MSAYFTPVKQIAPLRPTTSSYQTRQGDWICYMCNNLNFSFRKKCNRCKTQTRQQNQNAANMLINYYEGKFYSCNAELCASGQAHTSAGTRQMMTPSRSDKENVTPEKNKKQLPSVSPILKKYNARGTPMSESRSESSVWGVSTRDFQDVLGSSGRSEHEQTQEEGVSNDDLERMLSNIML